MKNVPQNDSDAVWSHNSPNKCCVLILYWTQKAAQCPDTAEGSFGWNHSVFGIVLTAHSHLPKKMTCFQSHDLWHPTPTLYIMVGMLGQVGLYYSCKTIELCILRCKCHLRPNNQIPSIPLSTIKHRGSISHFPTYWCAVIGTLKCLLTCITLQNTWS